MAEAFEQEITTLYEAREQEHEAKRLQSSLSPQRGPRLSNLSLERFRNATKYQDRPATADIAPCVAAFANGMTEDRIERALLGGRLTKSYVIDRRRIGQQTLNNSCSKSGDAYQAYAATHFGDFFPKHG